VGKRCAIIHPESFIYAQEFEFLCSLFAHEDIFFITTQEMYDMTSNIFSISPELVISDPYFNRLNKWLESKGISVATIPFREVAKQEGLFRCSTLPLIRL
jgi:N-dimethylarginine dimethylaminohydrolase